MITEFQAMLILQAYFLAIFAFGLLWIKRERRNRSRTPSAIELTPRSSTTSATLDYAPKDERLTAKAR